MGNLDIVITPPGMINAVECRRWKSSVTNKSSIYKGEDLARVAKQKKRLCTKILVYVACTQ